MQVLCCGFNLVTLNVSTIQTFEMTNFDPSLNAMQLLNGYQLYLGDTCKLFF